MFDLKLDLSEFDRMARQVNGAIDQVPFALTTALNEAAKVTRQHEAEVVWPGHVTVRNRNFMKAALSTEFASKRSLRVSIYDRLGRAHLKLHDKGGTKRARGKLAIPTAEVKRNSRGVSARQRPSALPNSFRQGDSIYQRYGSKKGKRIRRMYSLVSSAGIKADVPFSSEFARVMAAQVRNRFAPAMLKAMRTRR